MEAGMLSCPHCGAPASPKALRCTHCNVQLATTNCVNCLAMNFIASSGAAHCSACGEALGRTAVARSQYGCPRCQKELNTLAVGESILEECGACGGLWVDAVSFQRLSQDQQEQAAYLGMGSPVPAPGAHEPEKLVRYVPCPVCKKLMLRMNFARCSGVIVDVCKGHGTWFDRDELRAILEFIRRGGLDVAREKEKQQLDLERRRLKDQAMNMNLATQPEPDAHQYGPVMAAVRGLLDWIIS